MYESLKKGKIVRVELKPSIAEGLHGQIEESSITFDYVSKYVDDILLVREDDIKNSIVEVFKHHKLVIEGAGVVGLSALKRYSGRFMNRKLAVVLSGGNIDFKLFRDIICGS
jgi:threonine dehydratase